MPSSFVFSGHPAYLEAAAQQLDRPKAARGAGRLVALTALANLCAQASRADSTAGAAILLKAGEFRDQLAVALRAADAMLADVAAARVVPGFAGPADELPAAPAVSRAGVRKSPKRASL